MTHPSARPLAAALEAAGVNGKPADSETAAAFAARIRHAIAHGGADGT